MSGNAVIELTLYIFFSIDILVKGCIFLTIFNFSRSYMAPERGGGVKEMILVEYIYPCNGMGKRIKEQGTIYTPGFWPNFP